MTLLRAIDGPISWNTHCLITRLASLPRFTKNPGEPITVIPLEEFLDKCRNELSSLARLSREKIYLQLGLKPLEEPLGVGPVSVEDFFRQFRLNPSTKIGYVTVFEFEQVGAHVQHDPSREGPPGHSYIDTDLGSQIWAMDVYATYSDEPDWGMDQDVFFVTDYKLGQPPFGPISGSSSQAPFHMEFPHEQKLAYWLFPALAKSLLTSRAEMCFNLSAMAFDKKLGYWGWRFLAWATHYLQDITCPFHCRPFPPEKLKIFLSLLANPTPHGFYRALSNLIRSRHSLFEAIVNFLINDHVKKRVKSPLVQALASNAESFDGELGLVLHEVSKWPNILAPKINNLMVNLCTSPVIDELGHRIESDVNFAIAESIEKAVRQRPSIYEEFLCLVSKCLSGAAAITRFALKSAPS